MKLDARPVDGGFEVRGGLVVAHTHLYGALARGMPPPDPSTTSFLDQLQRFWWRLDRAHDAQSIAASARAGILDAVATGATCLFDHHESPSHIAGSLDLVADAFQSLGVRGVVCYGITARNGGAAEWYAGLRENVRFLKTNKRRLVRGMVGVHACFTVPDLALQEAAKVARDHGVGLHIHVGEDPSDANAVERLAACDALVPGSIFAHGVHIPSDHVIHAAAAGVWWVHNARSNALNGVGFARLEAAKDQVALGTDGIDGDMLAEARGAMQHAAHAHAPVDVLERLSTGQKMAAAVFGAPLPDSSRFAYVAPTPVHAGNLAGHVLAGRPRVSRVVVDSREVSFDGTRDAPLFREAARRLWDRVRTLPEEPLGSERERIAKAQAAHG